MAAYTKAQGADLERHNPQFAEQEARAAGDLQVGVRGGVPGSDERVGEGVPEGGVRVGGGGYRRTEYQMLLLVLVALEVEVEPGLVLVHELEHEVEVELQVEVGGEGTFP